MVWASLASDRARAIGERLRRAASFRGPTSVVYAIGAASSAMRPNTLLFALRYPKGCATPGRVPCQCDTRGPL